MRAAARLEAGISRQLVAAGAKTVVTSALIAKMMMVDCAAE
jgi:hypothetical protein